MTSSNGTFSTLLAICVGNSPVTGEFLAQRPVTRSFDVFFDLRLNKRLSKQSWGWWFETPWRSLWRHRNVLHRHHHDHVLCTSWYNTRRYTEVRLLSPEVSPARRKVISDHNIGQVVNTVELCHPITKSRPCATHCYMSRPCAIPLLCQGHVSSHYYVKAMCHPATMSSSGQTILRNDRSDRSKPLRSIIDRKANLRSIICRSFIIVKWTGLLLWKQYIIITVRLGIWDNSHLL